MTRLGFVKFLESFKADLEQNPSDWTNIKLEDFLEAMIRYTEDIQGFYDNSNLKVDADEPTWENFATILKGASVYE